MKRLAIAAAALLTTIGPLAATSAFADPPRTHQVQQHLMVAIATGLIASN